MSLFIKRNSYRTIYNVHTLWRLNSTTVGSQKEVEEEEFRVLDILKKRERFQKRVARKVDVPPDRAEKMPVDQVIEFVYMYNYFI